METNSTRQSCPDMNDKMTDTPVMAATPLDTAAHLTIRDILGGWMVRWGIGRMNYKVRPGLYRIGNPDHAAPVLVTANYKLTFDNVRKELSGLDVWLLVLDTNGVNVWCAAGKGTFGTGELVRRMAHVDLGRFVSHRTVILPQLGAPGIAAHDVRKATGFRVIYGPVYARDIRHFLENDMHPAPCMRRVHFNLSERLSVMPMQIVPALKSLPVIILILALFRIFDKTGINIGLWMDFIPYLGAVVTGTVLYPILIPWIPGRSFALNGWVLGLIWALLINLIDDFTIWKAVSHMLILPVITSLLAFTFTGSTTFTSLSGVIREVRIALPLMIAGIGTGVAVRVISFFIS